MQRMRIITFVCMLLSLSLVSWITKSYIFILLGGPISFAFFLQYPNMMKTIAINPIKRNYLDGENENIFPERTIDMHPEKIILNNEKNVRSITWKSIEKLLENDQYIYLFTSTTAAIIIPKRAIPSDAVEDFMSQAIKYNEESKKKNENG